MSTFISLASGSSGNCYLISDGRTSILIDAGLSLKKIEEGLSFADLSLNQIDAVVISHEHTDHIKSAGSVSKKYGIPVYLTEETFLSAEKSDIPKENSSFILPNNEFKIGSISVTPFSVPHDAANPVGYSFVMDNNKFSVATDIGKMNNDILDNIKGSIAIILESNYDMDMLSNGKYPYPLKKRISGLYGHLSNNDAAQVSLELVKSGTKHIMLGHLSRENNTPAKAIAETANFVSKGGFAPGKDFSLRVAQPFSVTDFSCEVISH